MARESKRHHIVPQSYLNRFAVDGSKDKVFTIIKADDGTSFIPANPTNTEKICVESDFYSRIAEGRPKDTRIEEMLAVFEYKASSSLLDGISPNTKHPYNSGGIAFTPVERSLIVATITMQLLRGKATRDLATKYITDEVYLNALSDAKKIDPDNPLTRKDLEYIKKHKEDIKNNAIVEGSTLEVLKDFSKSLIFQNLEARNCLLVVNTTSVPFVTSDEPIVIRDGGPEQHRAFSCPLDRPFSQVYFPIDPAHMIALYTRDMCHGSIGDSGIVAVLNEADIDFINYLNMEQYYQASRFVITNNKTILEQIARNAV